MRRLRDKQTSRGVVKTLVIIAIVGVLATSCGFVYQHAKASAATGTTTPPVLSPNTTFASYASTSGGFSFTYPSNWKVIDGTAGVDQEVSIVSPSATASNEFIMTLSVVSNPDYNGQPSAIPNGSVQKLTNGLNLWQAKEVNSVRPTATSVTACPVIKLVDSNMTHFSYPLSNGKYLALNAGYCEAQRDIPSQTYQQQLDSTSWKIALTILNSLKFE